MLGEGKTASRKRIERWGPGGDVGPEAKFSTGPATLGTGRRHDRATVGLGRADFHGHGG